MRLLDLIFGAPQSGRRALSCTLALLLIAAGLAGHLSTRGPREGFAPEGWRMSFRLPRGFLKEYHTISGAPARSPGDAPAEVYGFIGVTIEGRSVGLEYWRVRMAAQDSPAKLGSLLLHKDDQDGGIGGLALPEITPQPGLLGGRPAIQFLHGSQQKVVRVIVLDGFDAYAVRFAVGGQPLNGELLALFDDICAAVEFSPK